MRLHAHDFNVLQDMALLGAKDRHTGFVCNAIPLTMQSNITTCHLREERGLQGRREQSNENREILTGIY